MDTPQPIVTTIDSMLGWYAAGAGTVLAAFFGWLGSLWQARILQREQAASTKKLAEDQQRAEAEHARSLARMQQEHDVQIAKLGQDNDVRLRNLEARLEKVSLVHRVRFEKEFAVYQQAWAAITVVVSIALSFRPTISLAPVIFDDEERKKY